MYGCKGGYEDADGEWVHCQNQAVFLAYDTDREGNGSHLCPECTRKVRPTMFRVVLRYFNNRINMDNITPELRKILKIPSATVYDDMEIDDMVVRGTSMYAAVFWKGKLLLQPSLEKPLQEYENKDNSRSMDAFKRAKTWAEKQPCSACTKGR